MSSASGVSDWANQGDGGVKILNLSTRSFNHPPTHSFIYKVDLMLASTETSTRVSDAEGCFMKKETKHKVDKW